MKDKIIQIIENQGTYGLSESGKTYKLDLNNEWQLISESPEVKSENNDMHISGVDEAKKKLDEMKKTE